MCFLWKKLCFFIEEDLKAGPDPFFRLNQYLCLIFEVEDNGSGMDPETLEKVRKKLSGTFEGEQADLKKGGFGLNNVAQRLRMYYGDQVIPVLIASYDNTASAPLIFDPVVQSVFN